MRALTMVMVCMLVGCETKPELLPDGGSLEGPISFQITYNSTRNRPLLLQLEDGQRWLTVAESTGRALEIEPGCANCFCDRCSACQTCTPPKPRIVQVPFARSTSWTWSGLTFTPGACAEASNCLTRRSAPAGKYIARFCFGYAARDADGGQVVDSPQCEEMPFEYPSPDGGAVTLNLCDC